MASSSSSSASTSSGLSSLPPSSHPVTDPSSTAPPSTTTPTSSPESTTPTPSTTSTPPPPPSTPPPPPPPSTTPPPPPPPSSSSPPSSAPPPPSSAPPPSLPPSSSNPASPPLTSSPLSSFSPSVLPTPSTSVLQSTSVGTADNGQPFTSVVQVTTIVSSFPAVTNSPNQTTRNSSTNTGAIVGGVVGGVVGLAALAFLVWFILRKRRLSKQDDFDGNFDPARVVSAGHRGHVDLDDDEDNAAAITPFVFPTPAPSTGGPEMNQLPSTRHTFDQHALAAGIGAGAGAGAGTAYAYANGSNSPSPPPSAYYNHGQGPAPGPGSSWHGHGHPPPSDGGYTTTTSSGLPYAMPGPSMIGRGPSPGPSVSIPPSDIGSGSNSINNGYAYGRSAKEREALGGRLMVTNAGDGEGGYYGPQMHYPNVQPYASGVQQHSHQTIGPSAAQGAYPHAGYASYPLPASASATHIPPFASGPRNEKAEMARHQSTHTGVVVHRDAGRVSPPGDEDRQEEIPPTYDSLPTEEKR